MAAPFRAENIRVFHHAVILLIKTYCKLSYHRVTRLCDLLGITCPSKSALQYTAQKRTSAFWNTLLRATSGDPSYHYLRRIDGKLPRVYVKLNCAFDTRRKKFCTAKLRIIPRHDSKDAKQLLACDPTIVVADKGYNAEALYRFCAEHDMLFMCPAKKNTRRGYAQKKMHKRFRTRTYNRRQLVEAGFSSIKRKFGASVRSKRARTIRTEIYSRLICHNLLGALAET